jgi:hypothetical protein
LEVTWTAADGEAAVLAAVQGVLASPDLVHEHVRVQLSPARQQLLGVVAAAGFGQAAVRLSLAVETSRSQLVAAELVRTSGTAAMSTSVALALWSTLDVSAVTRLRAADAGAVAALADARVLRRFAALRVLNLSHAGLGAVPAAIASLTELQVGAGLAGLVVWHNSGRAAGDSLCTVAAAAPICCPALPGFIRLLLASPPASPRSCAWWATSCASCPPTSAG